MAGVPVEDALVKQGYASPEEIMRAKAEFHSMDFVELAEIEIPASVIELVPESLARENVVMPLASQNGAIKVIMHNPTDFETINRYYGGSSSETESVDSMLQEFTDTAIDFAEDGSGKAAGSMSNTLEEGDAPVIRLVHLIIQEAVNQ